MERNEMSGTEGLLEEPGSFVKNVCWLAQSSPSAVRGDSSEALPRAWPGLAEGAFWNGFQGHRSRAQIIGMHCCFPVLSVAPPFQPFNCQNNALSTLDYDIAKMKSHLLPMASSGLFPYDLGRQFNSVSFWSSITVLLNCAASLCLNTNQKFAFFLEEHVCTFLSQSPERLPKPS